MTAEENETNGNNKSIKEFFNGLTNTQRKKLLFSTITICVCAIIVLLVAKKLWNACAVLYNADTVPLFALVGKGLGAVLNFLLPFLLPVLLVLLMCIVVSVLHHLYTETRRYGSLTSLGRLDVIFTAIKNVFAWIVSHLPMILAVLLVIIALNTLLLGIGQFNRFVADAKRIKELTAILKNLSRADDIAQIKLLSQTEIDGQIEKTYLIQTLSEEGDVLSEQTTTLRGKEIAIDFITVNFEYSEIEHGEQRNLAYPYRIYSETMRPDDAEQLTCVFNDNQVPVMFYLSDSSIYGISSNAYIARLQELFTIINDETMRRELGIRSVNGVVPHFAMNPGETYYISVEGTGGLSIRKKVSLDDEEAPAVEADSDDEHFFDKVKGIFQRRQN